MELEIVKKQISLKIGRYFIGHGGLYTHHLLVYCARISKGRRLKEVILGTIAYGTLGCVLFFGILVTMPFIYKLVDSLMWLIFK